MFAKFTIICALAAVASTTALAPGYLSPAYALGAQAEHTIRGYGGLSSISKQAKAIDSAYATVRKSDIRFTNDGVYGSPLAYAQHGAYGSSALHGYAAPSSSYHGYHAPAGTISFARHGYAPGSVTHGYAQNTLAHGYAPNTLAHGYASNTLAHGYAPNALTHGYASNTLAHGYAPNALAHGYAPGAVAHGYVSPSTVSHHGYPNLGYTNVAKGVAVPGGLGVSYSPATAVSSSTFSGQGYHYGY